MHQNKENNVIDLKSYKEMKFVPWNYPPKPSLIARSLIENLNKLGREVHDLDGPAIEFRSGIDFIDIAYVQEKIAIEVDEEYHEDEERKEKDRKKKRRLHRRGWQIIRVSYKLFQKYNAELIAEALIRKVLKEKEKTLRPGDLTLKLSSESD